MTYKTHAPPNLTKLRRQFFHQIVQATARTGETTYGEWQDRIDAYLAALKPWLRQDDLLCHHSAFNYVPGSKIPFTAYPYGFFRAWLRRQDLDPDQYHPDESCDRELKVSDAPSFDGAEAGKPDSVPNRLENQRRKRGLTLEQLAGLIGLRSARRLREYEQGVKLPTLEHAMALEIILETPINVLFPGLATQAPREVQEQQNWQGQYRT